MNANIAVEFALAYQQLEKVKALKREIDQQYENAKERFREAESKLNGSNVSVKVKASED